jgi:hypothetical protein
MHRNAGQEKQVVTPYVVTGTLSKGRLVELDEGLPLADGKVRVSIEPLAAREPRPLRDVIAEIREQQRESGHVPPSREEIDRYLAEERESWER